MTRPSIDIGHHGSVGMTAAAGAPVWLVEDFGEPEQPAADADTPPPEPRFTAAELAAARQEAWNDGYLVAAAAGLRDQANDGQRIFAELLARADEVDMKLAQLVEHNATAIAHWLTVSFVTAFPNLSDGPTTGRTRAVVDLLRACLRSQSKIEVHGEAGPTVSFHDLRDVYRQIETQQLEQPAGGRITIAWQQGEGQIDPGRTWDEIRSALMPLAAGDPAESGFEMTITAGESTRHVG